MAPINSYRSLCISEINRNISDNSLKDEIYKKFEKYGDYFNIKISFFNNQRVAYINFTYDEDARRAHQEFHNLHLFNRSVKVEPVPLKSNRPRYKESRSPTSPFARKRNHEDSPPYSSLNHEIRNNAQKSYRNEMRYSDYPENNLYREPPKSRYNEEYAYDDDYNYNKPQYKIAPRYKNEWFYPIDATRSLFVGNIPEDMEEGDLYKIFKRYGPITDVDVKRAMKGKNNTYAFIKFFTLDYALRAKEEMQGQLIGKMQCKIGFGKPTPTKKLWIGGLGPWTTLSLLEREFDKYGPILKIDYLKGDSFAFILYDTVDSAENAYLEMKGVELENTPETKIMTDFSDTKTTFYDGSSVSTFLESYQKPTNYIGNRPMRNISRNELYNNEMATNERMLYHGNDDYGSYKKPMQNMLSPFQDEKYMSRPKLNKRSASFSPTHRTKRSTSSEFYGSDKKRHGQAPGSAKYSNDIAMQSRKTEKNGDYTNDKASKAFDRSYTKSSSRSRTSSYHSQSSGSNKSSRISHDYKIAKLSDGQQYNRSKIQKNFIPPDRIGMQEMKGANQRHQRTSSTSSRSTSSGSHDPNNHLNKRHGNSVNQVYESENLASKDKTHIAGEKKRLVTISKCTSLSSIITHLGPPKWSGDFTIKNSLFPLTLYFYKGDASFSESCVFPAILGQKELQIVQRFRLNSSKIEDMAQQINSLPLMDGNLYDFINDPCTGYSIFLALDRAKSDTGEDNVDGKSHKRHLKDLMYYLRQKNAAGVVFLDSLSEEKNQDNTNMNSNNVLFVFPPCDFTKQFFNSNFPNLNIPDQGSFGTHPPDIQNYLLIVVLKNTPKKKH